LPVWIGDSQRLRHSRRESANLVTFESETALSFDANGRPLWFIAGGPCYPGDFEMRFRTDAEALAAAILLSSLVTLLYWSIARDMAVDWRDDPNYSHGLLVPIFSAYLVWQERERLRALPLRGSWLGLPVLLAGLAVLLLGVAGAELFLL
jgi:hypothetical protein